MLQNFWGITIEHQNHSTKNKRGRTPKGVILFLHSQQPSLVQRCSSPHWDKSPQKKKQRGKCHESVACWNPKRLMLGLPQKIGLGEVMQYTKSNKQAESWPLPRSKRFGFSFFLWPSIGKRRSLYPVQLPIHLSIQCPDDSCHLTCSKLSPIVNLGFFAPHKPAPQTIKSSRVKTDVIFKSPSYPCHKQWLRHCKQMCPMEQRVLAAAVILAIRFALGFTSETTG